MKKLFFVFIFLNIFFLLFATRESLSFTQSESDQVTGPSNSSMPTSAISVEVWYYSRENTSSDPYRTIVSTGYAYTPQNTKGWMLRLPRSSVNEYPHARLVTSDGTGYVESDEGTSHEWHHLAMTYDGSEMKLYYDGILKDTVSLTGQIEYDSANLTVGNMANQINEPWFGYIDEVRIWNSALSASTINDWKDKEINSSHPNYSNLVVYYKFNEGSGQTTSDSSGNGYDGVLGTNTTAETSDPAWLNDSPLPVILNSFTGIFFGGIARLYWSTASEENNAYWNIFRASSNSLGQAERINPLPIQGAGTTTSQTNYSYFDENEWQEDISTYYYWLESVSYTGNSFLYGPIEITKDDNENITPSYNLSEGISTIYPNPFNPSTTISYTLQNASNVKIQIFNIRGELIKTFKEGYKDKNLSYKVVWNGKDNNGKLIGSGVYFIKLQTDSKTYLKKAILLK